VAKRSEREKQGNLFGEIDRRSRERRSKAASPKPAIPKEKKPDSPSWRMPARGGSTVAALRLSWTKRLTPAQVSQVEAELAALPRMLTGLGFGAVLLERCSVRRRKD
jgi:hypothetical protein